jgi:hypothetical protein
VGGKLGRDVHGSVAPSFHSNDAQLLGAEYNPSGSAARSPRRICEGRGHGWLAAGEGDENVYRAKLRLLC